MNIVFVISDLAFHQRKYQQLLKGQSLMTHQFQIYPVFSNDNLPNIERARSISNQFLSLLQFLVYMKLYFPKSVHSIILQLCLELIQRAFKNTTCSVESQLFRSLLSIACCYSLNVKVNNQLMSRQLFIWSLLKIKYRMILKHVKHDSKKS